MSTAKQQLALALDPSLILQAQGIQPDAWQRDLLLCNHRQILLNCSRQSGKSRTVSALALHTALCRPASLTLLLSPAQRQSAELFRKVLEGYEAVGRPVPAIGDSQTRLELQNRSRIVCLPAREETIRSFSGVSLLIIDEAARVEDDLYRSVRPMLTVSQGRLICLSTPYGQRGFFWQEWTHGGDDWHRVRIPWQECPRITPDVIEQERRSVGDSWVSQEYGCSFESLEGLVYPDFESRCGVATAPAASGRLLGGIDFGLRNPFCALWGHLDRDGILWITHEHYVRDVPLLEIAPLLPRNVVWYADPAGAQERSILRVLGLAVKQGANDIRAGIAAVRARLQTGRLRVLASACPNLLAEAQLCRYPRSEPGQPKSEKPIDEYNHALDALRYLVSRIDAGTFARFLKTKPKSEDGREPDPQPLPAPAAVRKRRPWLSIHNEQLWTPLN
jgi:hypothetical protein